MNFKIALKNVKKSIKDYAIYFLTLSFAVCIFYAFNSIGAESMIQSTGIGKDTMEMLSKVIGYISIFVSIVLGCLIIYANNFLIKRRKREMGLYISLGMGKRKISTILVIEELIIGGVSLICGIISGVVLSQFLGILTTKLFNLSIKNFKLVFSFDAMIKSIVYFGIIFVLVMIFNVIVVSRYKLIDLITAHKKNEKNKVKNPLIAGIIFIISLICIGTAYNLIMKTGLDFQKSEVRNSIILGVIGTILFFYGLTGFVVLIAQRIKGFYYKKLNIFVIRQINSKINTNFISMAVISLMLFITISLISVSIGFKSQNVNQFIPVSATLDNIGQGGDFSLKDALKQIDFKLPAGCKEDYINLINIDNIDYSSFLSKYITPEFKQIIGKQKVEFISLTDYNEALKMIGKKPVTLGENQIIAISNNPMAKDTVKNLVDQKGKLVINGKDYKLKNDKVSSEAITTGYGASYMFTVVANDDVVSKGKAVEQVLNIDYGNNKAEAENYIQNLFKHGKEITSNTSKDKYAFVLANTKIGVEQSQSRSVVMLLFISLYIASIFLVSSAAVLALQQLTEASDSYERYKALRKIGASKKQINKSIFIQTLTYFGLPLVLAIVHSIVGIYVANDFIEAFGKSQIISASLWTMVGIAVVYFGYFIVTYIGYKNIVKEK